MDPELIIQFRPILLFVLIITPGIIKEPSPMVDILEMIDFFDFKVINLIFGKSFISFL